VTIDPASLFRLDGKVALVTGGGNGIGQAIATGFAAAGADVAFCDLEEAFLTDTKAAIVAQGRRALAMTGDTGNPDDIDRIFAAIDAEFGRFDILVNNVGATKRHRPEEHPLDEWNKVLEIGVTGAMLCAQHAFARMTADGDAKGAGRGGSIINISSIAGAAALGRGNLSHSVNKGALNMLTKELAVEWAKHGIRVNAILPCQVLTTGFQKWLDSPTFDPALMDRFLTGIPMNRLARPDEMAGPAVFLASDAASMVTGVLLPVDGGNLALNAGGSHTWITA
jgi:NAD(P)-dependent dehydrogenase (short-subunit alcohol dehydrogenase family)